ncbi:hypothetical protein BDW74DRAFT_158265 [Aspergillus multicolor]|uniref:uncharacterized protein n=1 Tax=Aspergillus multicolor TaxID=41759 RepID=UPI003CCDE710
MFLKKSGALADGETVKKRDGIHWRMPTAMGVCWIIGLGLALGHHFYYFSLNGTIVPGQTQQEWSLRVGTGLAFLTKTFLTTGVGIACVQNLWWILRSRPVRLSTLDSMWDIRGNIFNFFDPHIWLRGPNVAVLGLISWCIPLVTVVTPSTLSVRSTIGTMLQEQQMPAIDYDFDKFYTMDDGGPTGPTPSVSRFITGAVIQGTIPNIPAPAPNSSYALSFYGPLIQCSNSSANVSQQVYDWSRANSFYSTAFFGFTPQTDNISYAMHRRVYTSYPGPDNGDSNADVAGKLIMTLSPFMPPDKRWVIECGIYNASYAVNFNFTNGVQSTDITDLKVLGRIRDYTQHELPKPANEDQLFAYTAMLKAFRDVLEGRCVQMGSICTDTQVYSTALINSKQIWQLVYNDAKKVGNTTYDSLGSILDVASELGQNITLSFFGSPYFLNTSLGPTVNVTVHPNQTEYVYSQRNLLLAYGMSVFISLLCIIAGLLTMWDNGIAFSDSPTTILRATRTPKFDEIVPVDSTAGADPGPQSLANTRVLWIPEPTSNDPVAGLRPLPNEAEPEKGNAGNGNESSENGLQSRSPIRFVNGIPGWERKTYRPTIERVGSDPRDAEASPGGFI